MHQVVAASPTFPGHRTHLRAVRDVPPRTGAVCQARFAHGTVKADDPIADGHGIWWCLECRVGLPLDRRALPGRLGRLLGRRGLGWLLSRRAHRRTGGQPQSQRQGQGHRPGRAQGRAQHGSAVAAGRCPPRHRSPAARTARRRGRVLADVRGPAPVPPRLGDWPSPGLAVYDHARPRRRAHRRGHGRRGHDPPAEKHRRGGHLASTARVSSPSRRSVPGAS